MSSPGIVWFKPQFTILAAGKNDGSQFSVCFAKVAPVPNFHPPWRTITIDRVEEVSDVVELAADGRGGYEFSVPLKTLGFVPAPGLTIKADLGILCGTAGKTTDRLYWHNKGTGLTADLPGEAMLTPAMWGEWRIGAE